MKPTFEQVIAYAQRDLEDQPARIPTPYEIALSLAGPLLASGKYGDDFTAAMETAWLCVVPFYAGQKAYADDVRTRAAIAQAGVSAVVSTPEADLSAAEARAYVTGGETGELGEARSPAAEFVSVPMQNISPDAVRERQKRIAETTQAVQKAAARKEAAERAVEAATRTNMKEKAQRELDEATAEFEAAARAQSEAYL